MLQSVMHGPVHPWPVVRVIAYPAFAALCPEALPISEISLGKLVSSLLLLGLLRVFQLVEALTSAANYGDNYGQMTRPQL